MPPARFWIAGMLLLRGLLPSSFAAQTSSVAQTAGDPLTPLDRTIAAAESSLREGELQIAESRYRSALLEGWMLMGALKVAEGQLPGARDAFRRGSTSAVETREALRSLALVHLRIGEAAESVGILTRLVGANRKDLEMRRLLAQALAANGQPEQAVQELEEARGAAPDDPELAFLLASGYLRLNKVETADRLFEKVVKARPMPQTHVLIGRTYRDFGEYDRARASLETALRMDPRARRAHYYLGTIAVMEEGILRLEEAIAEFQRELKLAPQDPVTNLRLGMALVEAHRHREALSALELAARSEAAPPEALHYLGRCQLALDQPAEAVASFRRALALSQGPAPDEVDEAQLGKFGNIHYQLALALRKLGATEDAAAHFAEAERASARQVDSSRERLARYLADVPEPKHPQGTTASLAPPLDASPFSALAPPERLEIERRVRAALARTYFNLGVMHVQGERFSRAAELMEQAAGVDPDFPQVQYSLAVAYFNSQQYDKAVAPLSRAFASDPGNATVRRMLALAWFNTEAYNKAVELLRDDPQRDSDPSLQFAYGLALVRSDRAAEAEAIFSRLLAGYANTPELSVVLGQAHAQQGDYDAAIQALERALQLKADVSEANATLGVIYLKQGRLAEAEAAFRAELAVRPGDLKARHNLATVLDLEGRPEEALSLLRSVLKSKPEFADARYLLGKILLAQGSAAEAVEHLEAAARLAPKEANIHYQLARALQTLGRTELAQQHFEIFRQLKDERRGRTP